MSMLSQAWTIFGTSARTSSPRVSAAIADRTVSAITTPAKTHRITRVGIVDPPELVCSARGEIAPERVGATRGHGAAELAGPRALAAELRAPRPEAARGEVQRVLVGEADGAVGLVGDAGADAGRLADAHLGDGDLEARVAALGGAEGRLRGDAGGGDVTREHREVLLDRLEVADGLAELLALGGVAHGLRQARLERTGHLRRARHGAIEIDGVGGHVRRRGGDGARVPEGQRVARLEGQAPIVLDRGGAARDQRDGAPSVEL